MSDVDAAATAEGNTAEETLTPESTPDGPDSGGPTDSPASGGGGSGDLAPSEWALPIGAVLLALAAGLGGWFLRGSTESAVISAEAVVDQGSVPPEIEGFFDSLPEGLEEFFNGESPLRDFFERRDFFGGSEGFGDLFGLPGDRREFEDPFEQFRDRFGDLDGLEGLEEFFRTLPDDRRPRRGDFFGDQSGDLPPGLEEFLERFGQFDGPASGIPFLEEFFNGEFPLGDFFEGPDGFGELFSLPGRGHFEDRFHQFHG